METLAVCLIALLAATVRGALGFGDALLAMPLLGLLLGPRLATPLVALGSLSIVLLMLRHSRSDADWPAALKLVAATIPGLPLGILLLRQAPEAWLLGGFGLLLLCYTAWQLTSRREFQLRDSWSIWPAGLVAGLLGGAANVNGPPVVVWCMLRGYTASRFRATLQGYFFPAALAIAVSHGLGGMWSQEVFVYYVCALPFTILGVWLGGRLVAVLPQRLFRRILYCVLGGLGLLLLARSFSAII